jgi:hypothetical protein
LDVERTIDMAYPPHLSPGHELREWLREQGRLKRLRQEREEGERQERKLRLRLLEQQLARFLEQQLTRNVTPEPQPAEVPAPASGKAGTLPGPLVESIIEQALRECHDYEDGEVGNYENEISPVEIAKELADKHGLKLGTVKAAVTNGLKRLFPSRSPGRKSGLETYRFYLGGRMLGRWFRERDGEGIAYGMIGNLTDVASQELRPKVASND